MVNGNLLAFHSTKIPCFAPFFPCAFETKSIAALHAKKLRLHISTALKIDSECETATCKISEIKKSLTHFKRMFAVYLSLLQLFLVVSPFPCSVSLLGALSGGVAIKVGNEMILIEWN